jgi:hypothetical protein
VKIFADVKKKKTELVVMKKRQACRVKDLKHLARGNCTQNDNKCMLEQKQLLADLVTSRTGRLDDCMSRNTKKLRDIEERKAALNMELEKQLKDVVTMTECLRMQNEKKHAECLLKISKPSSREVEVMKITAELRELEVERAGVMKGCELQKQLFRDHNVDLLYKLDVDKHICEETIRKLKKAKDSCMTFSKDRQLSNSEQRVLHNTKKRLSDLEYKNQDLMKCAAQDMEVHRKQIEIFTRGVDEDFEKLLVILSVLQKCTAKILNN